MQTIHTMPADARVWVYQSNRKLNDTEVTAIQKAGAAFIAEWAAHGASLKASFDVLDNLFVVIGVDEQQALASGCSIDKSVRFIKELEQQLNLNFFDRLRIAYVDNNEIKTCGISTFEELAKSAKINHDTIVFNNMITTKAAFDSEWRVPAKNSWQKKYLEGIS